jgi:hypothetical protein
MGWLLTILLLLHATLAVVIYLALPNYGNLTKTNQKGAE